MNTHTTSEPTKIGQIFNRQIQIILDSWGPEVRSSLYQKSIGAEYILIVLGDSRDPPQPWTF
jgi:hypothetical protein